MTSRFQAAALVASPSYPNSIAWSEENLIAVANGHLVTVLNPESPCGPRGLIKVPASKPYPIGMIEPKDLVSGCLLSTCLARDRECIRSISWSPIGMAANSGCLLAICTIEGRVKLYRPPFRDYSAEWIEVVDISERLYQHLAKVNFKNANVLCSEFYDIAGENQNVDNSSYLGRRGERKRKRLNQSGTVVCYNTKDLGLDAEQSSCRQESSDAQTVGEGSSEVLARAKSHLKKDQRSSLPLITAEEYASRSAMLSSLVIAWSPLLQSSCKSDSGNELSSSSFSVLAMGGKAGEISFWGIGLPKFYSVEHANVHPPVMFINSLQAHNSWVTAIDWLLDTPDSSTSHVWLASGSSDGSVKIWLGSAEDFSKPSEATRCPLILLKEIISADTVSAPISVLSLTMSSKSQCEMLVAVGKGSGSFEVWVDNRLSGGFEKISSLDAHDHVITGLAWAYHGSSLYSCSQDNFVRRWRLNGNSLSEVPFSSSTPGQRRSGEFPNAFYSCFGLAVSPGNVVLAMVRSFNSDLLNPMYESRSLKAAVEFFWIGGQDHGISYKTPPESKTELVPCSLEEEILCWKSNMLWSLKQHESPSRPLVVWDVIAALLVFKRTAPKFVEQFLGEWLSTAYEGLNVNLWVDDISSHMSRSFSKFSCRQLQLLNVICRRVALSEVNPDWTRDGVQKVGMVQESVAKEVESWAALVLGVETELRECLVSYSLSVCSGVGSRPEDNLTQDGQWSLSGLAQMKQWIAQKAVADSQLKDKSTGIRTYKRRTKSRRDITEEKCSFCTASVLFESPEVAFCKGLDITDGERHKHRLVRCATSMQICPPTTALWFCSCCHRRAYKLAPAPFFTVMAGLLERSKPLGGSDLPAQPLCPFCGVLMQRLQPDFLLSVAPV